MAGCIDTDSHGSHAGVMHLCETAESADLLECCPQERNVHHMKLVEGKGNAFVDGKALEDDKFNTVYVVVSQSMHAICGYSLHACLRLHPSMLEQLSNDS